MRKNYKDIAINYEDQFLILMTLILKSFKRIPFLLLFAMISLNVSAQCNQEIQTPFINSTYGNLSATGKVNGLCACLANNPSNLINDNLTDNATAVMPIGLLGGSVDFRVTDNDTDYTAGTYVGYKIAPSSVLSVNVLNSIILRTYLNGNQQETVSGASLLGLGLLNNSGPVIVGFNTTKPFDAIEISIGAIVGLLNTTNVYYPVIRNYCAGPTLSCNTFTAMNLPTYPVSIEPSHTGLSGVSVGSVSNTDSVISSSSADYASIDMTAGVAGSGSISVKDQLTDYPIGTYAGFDIENTSLLNVSALGNVSITTYLNGIQQEQFFGNNLAVNTTLSNSTGRTKLGFVSTKSFDEVQISLNQTLSLSLGTTKVYGAVFEKFCTGPALICNTETAMIAPNFPVYINGANTGINGVLCAACSVDNVNNLIDQDNSNYAQMNLSAGVAVTGSISVKDQITDYPIGTYAGFEIENSGLLNASVLGNVSVRTYLNGVFQEQASGSNLAVGASLLSNSGRFKLGFVSTKSFDEVQIYFNQTVSANLGTTKIYNAVFEKLCAGPSLVCNTQTPMIAPIYPVYINSANTGISGVVCALCSVDNAANLIDQDNSNYAQINLSTGVAAIGSISVKDQITDYPAGTYAGFDIENNSLLNASVLGNVSIKTYLNGVFQEQFSGNNLAVSASLLAGSGRFKLGFVSTKSFDEVQISLNQTVSLNLGTTKIYNAVFEKFCAGPDLACNTQTPMVSPDYPVYINSLNTGVDGLVCALCSVNNTGNLIDQDNSNYAQINLTVGVGNSASISVKDQITDYPAGSFAGYTISNPSLLNVNALDGVIITTYLNGTLQETKSGNSALVAVGTNLLVGSGLNTIGFVTTKSFDEVKISIVNTATVTLGVVNVYNAVFQKFCDPVIICNKTYTITNPDFPAIIDSSKTGINGIACVACAVNNTNNVLTASTTDFATVNLSVGVGSSASIAVLDQLSTYPAGTFAGFTVKDLGSLIQLDLFNSLTITTYLNGVMTESKTGSQLINLNLLTPPYGSGKYNVGFKTTKAFDEIRISVMSLASVINNINVYGAFIDTTGTSGGTLHCVVIDAVDDNLAPINGFTGNANAGNVLSNDTLGGIPVSASDLDLTITSSATPAFTGAMVPTVDLITGNVSVPAGTPAGNYTITYKICEKIDSTNCDSAKVVITVTAPVIDAVDDTNSAVVYGKAGGNIGINVLNNDTLNSIAVSPSNVILTSTPNGPLTVNADGTVTVAPNTPGGTYTVNYTICEKLNSTNCDTAKVTVFVSSSSIALVKGGTVNGTGAVGNTVTYTFTVTNTGNTTLNNILVNDPLTGSVNLAVSPSVLSPNQVGIATATYTIVQADVNAGQVTNSATVKATDSNGVNVTDISGNTILTDDPTVTTLTPNPKVALVKVGIANGNNKAGDTITYTFTVTNTGNTTLQNIFVNDPLTASVNLVVSPTVLQPNQTATATASYTITLADVIAKEVTNTATVTAEDLNGTKVTDTSGTTITNNTPTVTNLSSVALVKTGLLNGTGKAGDIITYTFTATNTGNTTLTGVVVNDKLTNSINLAINPAILLPNQTGTVTATYTITQVDVDAGKVTNSAKVTAKDPNNSDIIDISGTTLTTDDSTVTVIPNNSSIALVKTGVVNGDNKVGDTITYTFTVTNTGNTTLNGAVINDALTNSVNLAVSPAILLPNQTGTATATYKITQSDINAKKVTNTATVIAKDPKNADVTDISGTTITNNNSTVTDLSSIALVKTGLINGTGKAGDTINYTFTVTNTGNTTLSGAVVNDKLTNSVNLAVSPAILLPNQTGTATATYTITQSDVDAGQVTNSANVTAKNPNNSDITDISGTTISTDDPTVTVITPKSSVALVKTGSINGTGKAGDIITYTFTVTNTGNTTLHGAVVNDLLTNSINLAVSPAVLLPNQTGTATASYIITQSDVDTGKVTNSARVTAKDPNNVDIVDISGTTLTTDDSTVTIITQKSSIALVKTGIVNGIGKSGDTITYTFTVTNTGNTTLTNVLVNDSLTGSVNLVVTPNILLPNQTGIATATYTITQTDVDAKQVTNSATVSAKDPNNNNVIDTSGTTITTDDPTITTLILKSSIALVKTGSINGTGKSGDTITYIFTVTNTGNTTLSGALVNDLLTDSVNLAVSPSILFPNQTGTAIATYMITQSDVDAGQVTNSATVTAKDPSNSDITDMSGTTITTDDPTITQISQKSSIALVKTGLLNGTGKAGDIINYTFTVTNTGNTTLIGAVINDTLTNSVNLAVSPAVLLPNQTGTATASYIITQSDVDAGKVANSAKVTAKDPNGVDIMDTSGITITTDDPTLTIVTQNSSIALVKTGVVNGTGKAGDTITYTFTVTNTGNTTLNTVFVNDSLTGSINLAVTPNVLEPNQTGTATATYVINQSDIDLGKVTNTATVSAKDPNNNNVIDISGTTITTDDPTVTIVTQNSSIALVKTGKLTGSDKVGDVIAYTFTVTNTGNTTLNNVVINDALTNSVNLAVVPNILLPNQIGTATATYTITQFDVNAGQVVNTATVSAKDPSDKTVTSTSGITILIDKPTVIPVLQNPSMSITKDGVYEDSNNNGKADVGDIIRYSFVVTNTGDVILTNIVVTDNNANITGGPLATLDVGQSDATTFSAIHTITQADIESGYVYNLATVSGDVPGGQNISAVSSDPTPCTDCPVNPNCPTCTITKVPQSPSIALVKTGEFDDINKNGIPEIGETITFSFEVINTGDCALSNITIDDKMAGITVTGGPIDLPVGGSDSTTFKAVYTLTVDDLKTGSVTNSAIVYGTSPLGVIVSDISDDNSPLENDETVVVLGACTVRPFNAVSPDGDGLNDFFRIAGIECFPNNKVEIYNRWGVKIFDKSGYDNSRVRFDGISDGRSTVSESDGLPSGTYFYTIKYTDDAGKTLDKSGYLMLAKE